MKCNCFDCEHYDVMENERERPTEKHICKQHHCFRDSDGVCSFFKPISPVFGKIDEAKDILSDIYQNEDSVPLLQYIAKVMSLLDEIKDEL